MLIRQSNTVAGAMEVLSNDGLNVSFSAFGEDRVLFSILKKKKRLNKRGFYIDVGAHHPWKKSNTALLSHFKRWKGINIDASLEAIKLFDQERPRDVNICAAVSDEVYDAEYAIFNRPAVNTLNPEMRQQQIEAEHGAYKLEKLVEMTTKRLDSILDKHVEPNQEIDFMSVDVEGMDVQVLKSNNWDKYRPYILAVETHGINLNDPTLNATYNYLCERDYELISHTFVTSFFIRK